jgi:excisionase family DNA binding protein
MGKGRNPQTDGATKQSSARHEGRETMRKRQNPNNEVMSAEEVSSWLRIPRSTLYKLCNDGQIPCTKIGKHWRFDKIVVENWFEQRVMEGLK